MTLTDSAEGGRSNRWNGYQAYQYLEAGTDYEPFDVVAQVDRVPEASVSWSDDVQRRAAELHERSVIVSLHDHLSARPVDPARFREYRRLGREVTPYEGLANTEVDLVFDGGPAAISMIRSHTSWSWDDAVSDIGMRQCDWAHQGLVRPVRRLDDVYAAKAEDAVGVVLTLESCSPIGNDVDRLDILFGLGVRLMGLVYSESNLLGGGLADTGDAGLTSFGRQVVQRMNKLGMLVDVSHCGDRTSLDAMEVSESPVLITHAGARSLWSSARMKPDEVIKACAATGGVIGIEAAPHTTLTMQDRRHSLDTVMAHVEYCIDLVGVEHVALGPDTNFGDHVAWHQVFSSAFGASAEGAPEYEEVEFVRGCENPREAVPNMVRWLLEHGYSDEDVEKIASGNVLRILGEVWPA
jgi:membrane dipeptidase